MKLKTECNLSEIIFEILNGKTVVFPTETSYGLGCDATNQAAVDKIFKIKGRKSDKPLLVVVPTVDEAKKYLKWNSALDKLSKKYWPARNATHSVAGGPGPLTIVGEARGKSLASGVVAKDNTVAVRVTTYPLLVSITEKIGRPLVATSANISEAGEIYEAEKIYQSFEKNDEKPDLILNYGILPKRPPTTIIRIINENFEVLRQGEVEVEL